MNYPSVKRIAKTLNLSIDKAKLVRGIIDNSIRVKDNEAFPNTNKWIYSCYNTPSRHEIKMEALNETIGGFGVEVLGDVYNYPPRIDAEYVNLGDTYIPTIVFHDGRYKLTSWGDIVEKFNL